MYFQLERDISKQMISNIVNDSSEQSLFNTS